MTYEWKSFVDMLKCRKTDDRLASMASVLDETPEVESNDFDNEFLDKTIGISFLKSGIQFTIINDVIEQITFFLKNEDHFMAYQGDIPMYISSQKKEKDIIKFLGIPNFSGGGKVGMFSKYIDKWIKYKKEGYFIHFEFGEDGFIKSVNLIAEDD